VTHRKCEDRRCAGVAGDSGERTRLACSLRRLAAMVGDWKSSRWRGRHRQHARRVRSPEELPAALAKLPQLAPLTMTALMVLAEAR
jgi:hypothetical protein